MYFVDLCICDWFTSEIFLSGVCVYPLMLMKNFEF